MFNIIIYHIYLVVIAPISGETFHKAIWLPLHVGVPLFVLISGYFGIKASPKGLIKLLGKVFVLTVPVLMIYNVSSGCGMKGIIKSLLFVSNTPYWFVRIYVLLYLFSPVINHYLSNISDKKNLYLLTILGWMSVYIGTSHGEPSLIDGKNLINFLFLYCLGNSLRKYESMINRRTALCGGGLFIVINLLTVTMYTNYYDCIIGQAIWRLSFDYCSPILIFNSVLLFVIFSKINIKSNIINIIASSTFSMYLIHLLVLDWPISDIAIEMYNNCSNEITLFLALTCFTIIIMSGCMLIDKILSPVWRVMIFCGDKLNERIRDFETM